MEWLHIRDREHLLTLPRVVHRGKVLYREGQSLQALYIVKAGSLKISIASAEGSEQVIRFQLPGDLVAMDGLQRRILNSSAIALETTGLCELPAHQLDSLSQRFAIVQHRLIKHLAGQLSSAQTMLLIMSKRTAEERVATFIVDLMQRLETRGFSGKEFDLSMTRYDIASYLGLAVETVSRAFKALESEGLVNVRARHIRIKNVAALRVLASACS